MLPAHEEGQIFGSGGGMARLKQIMWMALFFGSLAAIFVLLIWLANRYPASPTQQRKSYRAEVK